MYTELAEYPKPFPRVWRNAANTPQPDVDRFLSGFQPHACDQRRIGTIYTPQFIKPTCRVLWFNVEWRIDLIISNVRMAGR